MQHRAPSYNNDGVGLAMCPDLWWSISITHNGATSPTMVVTEEDRRRNRRWEHRLGIAEMDEHTMAEWHRQFPQDALDKRKFFAQRRTE
ncbi:Ethylene-responsive transcription factor CRF1 [Hordeum vulgare]|nr:Ethylene-responsive transcription factor CRF1 [Hordeum vulgare]